VTRCAGPMRRGPWRSDAGGRLLLGLAVLTLSGAAPLMACFGPEYYAVHFTTYRWPGSEYGRPDFFRMPQPWRGVPPEKRALAGAVAYFSRNEEETPDRSDIARRAIRFEAAGRFRQAAAAWMRYRQEWSKADPDEIPSWPEPYQSRGLEDRIAALTAWRGPRDTVAMWIYLRARDLVNVGKYNRAQPLLARLTRDPFRTHAEYLQASIRFYSGTPEASATAYRSFLRRHPRHQLGLYMVGRSFFRPIRSEERRDKLAPEQVQRYLRKALAAYEACAAADPHTSLAEDARGKAVACLFGLEEYAEALFYYCRQLAGVPPGADNHAAFLSARMCLEQMTLADHRAFQARAVTRPEVASVYLDLLLHYGQSGVRTIYNLGLFALEVLKRRPATPLSGRLLARLALIEGRLGHWKRAERLAAAALERCAPGAYRDQARWQHALALRQLRRRREALAEYERLAASALVPKMRRGAHEAAAVLSEEMGDRPNAIRHYLALEYRLDYGYLVDCLATQDELRAFLRRFPEHPRARLIRYSLGFRQLRASEYDAAARTFVSLGPWLDVAEKVYDCATDKGKPRWPPLRTARFLADAVRREAAARTDAEKARAAYSRAQLLFWQRHLVLYNGALWKGWRWWAFDIHSPENTGGIQHPDSAERRAYDRYQEEHTALYQALRGFERIANEYPRTPEAPRALYSAALCYTLLLHVEAYWTNRGGNYTHKAMQLYHRLQRDYPNDQLAAAAARYGGRLPPSVARRDGAARRSGE
jgi:outer membrane protein assembly factor BamD (BamD/ComL family)